jgi:N-acetylgalactosamine kinase
MNIDTLINKLSNNSHETNSEIKNIYQCDDIQAKKYIELYLELCNDFKFRFPESKEINIVRAPGRVNLIGEHTDYNSLPVLPIAIENNVICIFSPNNNSTIRLYNHDVNFDYREFDINIDKHPYRQGDWGNYVKAGIFWHKTENKQGFNALFFGNISVASGLSSSSALVVASGLAFLETNKIHFNKKELAEHLAKAEKYVGTMSGGMDQAISLLGKEGTALKIDFHPLSFETATIPDNISFVVINSMIRAAKTENAGLKYNRRAIECSLITALINKFISKKFSVKNDFLYIGSLKKEYPDIYPSAVDYLLNNVLNKESFTAIEISNLLDIPVEELKGKQLKIKDGPLSLKDSFFPEPEDGFKLKQRFIYIVNESNRVDEAIKALSNGNIKIFGELMNQSHQDARNLYEISTPELDYLCEVALSNGAFGARLTGAGFGGCIVSVIDNNKVPQYIKNLKNQYFYGYLKEKNPELYSNNLDTSDKIFVCKPCKGAGLLFNNY